MSASGEPQRWRCVTEREQSQSGDSQCRQSSNRSTQRVCNASCVGGGEVGNHTDHKTPHPRSSQDGTGARGGPVSPAFVLRSQSHVDAQTCVHSAPPSPTKRAVERPSVRGNSAAVAVFPTPVQATPRQSNTRLCVAAGPCCSLARCCAAFSLSGRTYPH